jgi:2-polyprenyl-3-methyl-5-hydroxy-6-metoxy-1,4-benzoquinol methylase
LNANTPLKGSLHDYHDGQYVWDEHNPRGYGNRMGRYRTRLEWEFMARHLGRPPLRVLDVGGGSGRLGTLLHSLGHKVTVVDHNHAAVQMARAKGFERAEVCDLLQFDGRHFDVVTCMEVIEYFKDCAPVLAKCAEFLQPGGIFLFCVINARSWRFRLRHLKRSDCPASAFSPVEVERACAAAGLEIVERRGFQWCLAPASSDSRLVSISAAVEKWFGLNRWHSQSPWLLYAARRLMIFQVASSAAWLCA